MKISGKRWMRMVVITLLCILAVDTFRSAAPVHAENTQSADSVRKEQNVSAADMDRITYYYYSRQYTDAVRPKEEIAVNLKPDAEASNAVCYEPYTNLEGSAEGLLVGKDAGTVTFRVNVPESGLYNIALTYLALAQSSADILLGFQIDGAYPFAEASSCLLGRTFQNGEIRQNDEGDDIRPLSTQLQVWRTQYLTDLTGVNGELSFYLEEGEHRISLTSAGVPFLLESITIGQKPYALYYKDYVSLHKQQGAQDTKEILKVVQAENFYLQSNSTLWPIQDRTSPLTEPFDYDVMKLNAAGGSQWKTPGQWISWEIEVPEDGFYQLGIKYRQTYLEGLYSSRRLLIDGEVPFREFENIKFEYDSQWKMKVLSDENENPYKVYLTAGKHILTLENVVGDLSSTLDVLQTAISNLNELYLSVIMVTGSDPDPYRDYYLADNFPELSGKLLENADMLFAQAECVTEEVGEKGTESAFLEDIAYNLQSYAKNIEDLTYKGRIANLRTDITSLSNKISELGEQALDIDYFVVASEGEKMPKTTPNLAEWLKFQVGTFMASFRAEQEEKTASDHGETVRVWLSGAGNDQYQIMRDMIDDLFTPATGTRVDLELVSGSLVEATVAGEGPDVAIGIDADTVVNLALRGALTDMSGFEGFKELEAEYIDGCFTPFTLEGRTYGICNVNAFTMMFVRTDIFERLGLEIPTTWDEMYDVTQVLQQNNMDLGTNPGFATLLYQNGGSFFNDELTEAVFDEEVSVSAFKQYTEFYTKYGYPLTYDFLTRFRSGELPIALAGYNMYNTLKYSAPEINGLWGMYTLPGTVREDGTVNYTQADSSGTGTILFNVNDNEEAAWEFIRWWSGAEAQTRYGKDLEAVMGVAARYATANCLAFESIDWTQEEKKVLLKQIDYMEYIPIVPGNYYVSRGINNAFRAVVNDGENPRELLLSWTKRINDEITRKRAEFYMNN